MFENGTGSQVVDGLLLWFFLVFFWGGKSYFVYSDIGVYMLAHTTGPGTKTKVTTGFVSL